MTIVRERVFPSGQVRYEMVDTVSGRSETWHKPNNLHRAEDIEKALYAAAEQFTVSAPFQPGTRTCMAIPKATDTLQDYLLGYWLPREAPKVAPATRYAHESYVRLRIGPQLGAIPIGELTALQLSSFFDGLSASGLAIATIRKYWSLLNRALDWAARHDVIPMNPMSRCDHPVRRADEQITEVERLSVNEIIRIQSELEKEPLHWKCLLNLLLDTGLRVGEAVGLKWDDVSFRDRTVTVRRSICYTPKTGLVERQPKANSFRTIDVSDDVMICLLTMYCTRSTDSPYIWHQSKSPMPMHPSTPTHYLAHFKRRVGLERLYPHMLRHTFASTCITAGASITSVSKLLGHQKSSVTLDMYSSATKEDCFRANALRRSAIAEARIG